MKHACPICGKPSPTRYCPAHTRPTGTRNPARDLNAQKRMSRAVKNRDGHRCTNCGATTDLRCCHLVPLHQGGSYDPSNGVTRCGPCDRATDPYAR